MIEATLVDADFPEALEFLFEPARYKIIYGGRGAAKSWGVARYLLLTGAHTPTRVLCAREIQKSMKESVHQLLQDQIKTLDLSGAYRVFNDKIEGPNGTLFVFAGLKHNVANIKSLEGIDKVWVEEAQAVSKSSWDTLVPTIRKSGSEIIVTFNPDLDTDETYRRFVISPPDGAIVRKMTYRDNFWFPDVLEQERVSLLAKDPDAYSWVWEGNTKIVLDGAVYAKEIREAVAADRFTSVPVVSGKPVHLFWDFGKADMTSVWMVQVIGFDYRIVDFYQNRGFLLAHYIQELQKRPYTWGDCWIPHDAYASGVGTERTIERQLKDAGYNTKPVPRLLVDPGINAARTIFSQCFFDQNRCSDGISSLQRYSYEVKDGQWSQNPKHDDYSHAADAFRYFAVSMKTPQIGEKPKLTLTSRRPGGWMR